MTVQSVVGKFAVGMYVTDCQCRFGFVGIWKSTSVVLRQPANACPVGSGCWGRGEPGNSQNQQRSVLLACHPTQLSIHFAQPSEASHCTLLSSRNFLCAGFEFSSLRLQSWLGSHLSTLCVVFSTLAAIHCTICFMKQLLRFPQILTVILYDCLWLSF